MYSGKPTKDTTDVIYVLVRRRMTVSSTRWQLTIGDIAVVLFPTGTYARAPGRVVTHVDYPLLEKIAESATKDRQKFERLVVSKEKLLEMFYVS